MNKLKRHDILQRLITLTALMADLLCDIPTKDEDPLCDNLEFNHFETAYEIAGEYINMVNNREYEEE